MGLQFWEVNQGVAFIDPADNEYMRTMEDVNERPKRRSVKTYRINHDEHPPSIIEGTKAQTPNV